MWALKYLPTFLMMWALMVLVGQYYQVLLRFSNMLCSWLPPHFSAVSLGMLPNSAADLYGLLGSRV